MRYTSVVILKVEPRLSRVVAGVANGHEDARRMSRLSNEL